MQQRLHYFDFLRGIAILMVVAIHTYPNDGFGTPWTVAQAVGRQLISASVPIFLAISGFFLARKDLDTWPERMAFWRKQVPKIYLPCIIWSVPLFLLQIRNLQDNPAIGIILRLAYLLACGYSIYYFIALIIQCYVLLPWQSHVTRGRVICFALLSFLSVATVNFIINIEGYPLPLLIYAAPFPVYGFFFVLGVWLSRQPRNYRLLPLISGTVAALVLSVAEAWWQYGFHGGGLGLKMSTHLYSTFLILLLFSRRLQNAYTGQSFIARIVRKIGEVSFGVYLIHCYFIAVLIKLWPSGNWFLTWLIVTGATVTVILAVRRIAPNFAERWLGFR